MAIHERIPRTPFVERSDRDALGAACLHRRAFPASAGRLARSVDNRPFEVRDPVARFLSIAFKTVLASLASNRSHRWRWFFEVEH
jgi:hypothetical protein